MSETDPSFVVGDALPRIASVSAGDDAHVTVTWAAGTRAGRIETIDIAPAIFRYRVYAPLRGDLDLFRSVHVAHEGFAIAWGHDDAIDMASTMLEDLARQTMTPADFAAFVKRHGYSYDSVAAELGISRRQAAYYQRAKAVPRYIALACAYLDQRSSAPDR